MPISRFGATLLARGNYESYMQLLKDHYHREHLETVMCRDTVSVDWLGYLYDCDFNQQLALPLAVELQDLNVSENAVAGRTSGGKNIWTVDSFDFLKDDITMDHHCFGCTAGAGSSCQGAVVE